MPFAHALVAAVGVMLSRRKAPAKVSEQKGASRKAQAKVVPEAELSAKLYRAEMRKPRRWRRQSHLQNLCFEREPWFIKARIREAAIDLWLRP